MEQSFGNYFGIQNRTSRQILRELIFFSSGFMLPECGVEFSQPVAHKPLRRDPLKCNTRIRVTMVGINDRKGADEGYATAYNEGSIRGSRTFWYRRIDLRTLASSHLHRSPVPITRYPSHTYELLGEINRYYSLKLEEEDVENLVYRPGETAYLVASPASLPFTGRVRLDLRLPSITSVAEVVSIGGFNTVA